MSFKARARATVVAVIAEYMRPLRWGWPVLRVLFYLLPVSIASTLAAAVLFYMFDGERAFDPLNLVSSTLMSTATLLHLRGYYRRLSYNLGGQATLANVLFFATVVGLLLLQGFVRQALL